MKKQSLFDYLFNSDGSKVKLEIDDYSLLFGMVAILVAIYFKYL